jgi:release factor glutamine methyltransferase
MPVSEEALRLLGPREFGIVRTALGRILGVAHRIAGSADYDSERIELVAGVRLLIAPSVFNPRLLRTGEYFARVIAGYRLGAGGNVLDLGTGSGICAIVAARHARRVVAVDINPAAVRCATVNAQLNGVEQRIECRTGDLFAPVAGERFDAIFFNPPFASGAPSDARDCAWRSTDVATRYAAQLAEHLAQNGRAWLLLSTWGDACATFVDELVKRGFRLEVFAVRSFVNERVTILEVRPASEDNR